MEILIALLAVAPLSVLSFKLLARSLGGLVSPQGLFALSASLALGLLALFTLLLGLLNLLNPIAAWSGVLLFLVSSLLISRPEWGHLGIVLVNSIRGFTRESHLNQGLLGLSFAFCLLLVAGAYFPQIADDSLYYHFALPKLFIQEGGLFFFPYNFTSVGPLNIEMLFTLGLLLKNEFVANSFNVLITLVFGLLIYALILEFLGRSHALFWTTVFYSLPLVMRKTTLGYIDLGMGLFGLSAVYLLLMTGTKKNFSKGAAVWTGIFLGLSTGTKLNAGATALALVTAFFVVNARGTVRKMLTFTLIAGLLTLITSSPWNIRAILHTGNPLYPAFQSSLFGGKVWDTEYDRKLSDLLNNGDVSAAPLGREVKNLVLAPFHIFYPNLVSDLFRKGQRLESRSPYQPPELTFLFVAFFPFTFLYSRKKQLGNPLSFSLLASALTLIPWYFLVPQEPRFLTPLFGFFVLWAALGLAVIFRKIQSRFLILVSKLACALWFATALGLYGLFFAPKLYALTNPEQYLIDYGPFYRSAQWANHFLGRDSKLALLSEIGPYYFDIPYVHGGPVFHEGQFDTQEDLYRFFEEQGVTHLFVYQDAPDRQREPVGKINAMIYTSGVLYFSDQAKFQSVRMNRIINELLRDSQKTRLVHEMEESILGRRTPRKVGRVLTVRFYALTTKPD